ncbi:MAG TPA: GNAT family N-acetyltransferase [Blastocatellia bacterium]|nr:GNAT family N-acetyltransferase [Blastocatellia bacterium]
MQICETERLTLRQIRLDDAPFFLELLNEPSFLNNIGDKGVRNLDDAHQYLINGPIASYEKFGFGLYLVELKDSLMPIGMCGLLKREGLTDPDIGYAFLPRYWSKGYAIESADAVMKYGRDILKLKRIVAITKPDNHSSIRVLNRLGLRYEKLVKLPGIEEECSLFTPGC